uniref:adhesion G-protein coupled receptor D1-like n=1 Tax=Ciona intestinalis TaxID=7719 RepID=UPI00089DCDCB|nr:adhesion G-protein coupled receptor D1-like [Ciona intestinalis]|eukprot:XP_018669615.1 adhesion G-protein coupled receptor D1-like [Ciona intestinalis]
MVQISLTLALLLFHLFTLFSEVALLDSRACIVTTIGTHYFLLASALWMMVEGLTLFLKTTDSVLHAETTHFYKLLRYVTGWGVPVFIVGIVAVIGLKNGYYIDQTPSLLPTGSNGLPEYQKCWLSRSLTIYGAIIPVSLTILINFCVLVKVGIFIYNMSRSSEQFKPSQSDENNTSHLKAVFYAVLKLVPVLGTTWILLLVAGENVGLLYVATIMNGLQGVFLLVIYCVLGSAVRNAFMRYIKMRFMNSESELKLSTRRKTTETGVSQRVEEVTESQM